MKLNYNPFNIELSDILPILTPVISIYAILILVALIDLYKNRDERNNKLLWAIIIIALNAVGPVLYFAIGRRGNKHWN